MTPIQFTQLLKKNKIDVTKDVTPIFELLNEFAELEYQNFVNKKPQNDAANHFNDIDISLNPQKEAA